MEKIISIKEVENFKDSENGYHKYDGYEITTDKQTIKMGISNEQSCCESWGYFMTEDDLSDFIGSDLISVYVTDTLLKTELLVDTYDGDSMYVNINTSNGLLQFVAYNAHNGYYGHDAVVISRDFYHSEGL